MSEQRQPTGHYYDARVHTRNAWFKEHGKYPKDDVGLTLEQRLSDMDLSYILELEAKLKDAYHTNELLLSMQQPMIEAGADLQEKLRAERARVTDLEMKWHLLSVQASIFIRKYAHHAPTCTSIGSDDRPCDCGYSEAAEALMNATVWRGPKKPE